MIISEGINHGKLQSIIVGELKKAGLKHRLKKIILKSVKDNKTLFGAPLVKAPSCSVICCGSTLSVPIVVSEMSAVLRSNAHIEGLFRKAGSQSRQKDIKRLLDAGGCVSEGHHPIDVASVLKLYLRCLPEPLISAEVQDLLLRCRLAPGEDALKSTLNTLLLLPVSHVHLLHYVMELLNFIASHHKQNLMDSSNLAIVMAPSVMPLPATATPQRLDHHVALVKMFIENAQYIGVLSDELMARLDDEDDSLLAKRKKRRSGSINRVLSGLRKMVSGNAHNHTPAPPRESGKTPVISKSAVKRKFDGYEGLSSKKKKEIKQILPQKELMFTPMKLGLTERKKLRLSFMDARSGRGATEDSSLNKISISSQSSGCSELFTDTIDLSLRPSAANDYVRISKQEYEEIKSRVSAIESRLSQEFTDITPRVEPLQQVQNVYQKTLHDVARLDEACPTSDHLARRLSKELKIRPNEHPKIIRSPSARKIGTIRRRSKENTKIVRHKSWNVPSQQASHNADRFYPYAGLRRARTSTAEPPPAAPATVTNWDAPSTDSLNSLDASQKYQLRKRSSLATDLNKTIGRQQKRRSLNSTLNTTFDVTASDHSRNNTLNSSIKSDNSSLYQNVQTRKPKRVVRESPSKTQQKWKSAAAFFMEKTGEIDSSGNSGRPSVNKLRSQNAGAVLAKARLFETSSDKSSEQEVVHTGFARRPRVSGHYVPKSQKNTMPVRGHVDVGPCVAKTRNLAPPAVPPRQYKDIESWRARRSTPPAKKAPSPQPHLRTPQQLPKRPMLAPRSLRPPAPAAASPAQDARRTPMKAVHISPRRRSPRQKLQR